MPSFTRESGGTLHVAVMGVNRIGKEQGFRGLGWRARRRGHGGGSHRPPCAPLPHRQHPGQQLPDEGSSEPAAVRLGSTQEKSRRVIAGSNGDRSGDTRPLWITGLSPPDSWRSLRQPGYLQLDQVRHPKHRVWGYDRTLKVRNFRSTKVGNFQSQLTYAREMPENGGQIDDLKASQRQMQGCADLDVLSIRLVATVRSRRHRD